MSEILTKDIVKGIDAIDMVAGSIAKPLVEAVASRVVGNGNLISGVAKLGLAVVVAKYGGTGRVQKAIAIGSGMDGAEDIVIYGKTKLGGGATQSVSGGVF